MSQIKLLHSGGNGVNISAPDTNPSSDRTVKLPSTDADGTITTKDSDNQLQQVVGANGGQLSHRNKVINGAMIVSQRGTSFTPGDGADIYTIDRFEHFATTGANGNSTIAHSSDAPDEFTHSYKVTPDNTNTPTGSGNIGVRQKIEGQDLQDLAFATSSAKTITVSFYAKSAAQNSGHQYTVQLRKFASSGQDADRRSVNSAFTVTDSWQRFTFTFAGDTSKDIIDDSSVGMEIVWILNSGPDDITSAYPTWSAVALFSAVTGQSNFQDNTNNYFYLTGVQLEVGDTATLYEHRNYADELRRCQRYYVRDGDDKYHYNAASATVEHIELPVQMRADPTIDLESVPGSGSVNRSRVNWFTVTSMGTSSGNIRYSAEAEI